MTFFVVVALMQKQPIPIRNEQVFVFVIEIMVAINRSVLRKPEKAAHG
jgi:hypothetical protein